MAASPSHENNFNALRLLLASLVIVSHSFELIDGNSHRELVMRIFGTASFGQLAVDGFFLLSGYLVLQSWASQPEPRAFLRKRVLRIYPGFILCALFCGFVVGPLGAPDYGYFDFFRPIEYITTVLMLVQLQLPTVFPGSHYPAVNGSMWSIVYEFCCYLMVVPLGLLGVVRRRWLWVACTLGFMACDIGQRLGYHNTFTRPYWVARWVPNTDTLAQMAMFFFVGGCFYLFRQRLRFERRWLALCLPLTVAGLFSLRLVDLSMALGGGYLLFYTAFTRLAPLRRVSRLPDISYGIYLYAWPVQKLCIWYIAGITPLELIPLAWCGSALLALVSWYGVEKPCLNLKYRRRQDLALAGGGGD